MLYVNPLATPYSARMGSLPAGPPRDATAFRELEHFFLYMLLQEMTKTVPKGGLFDAGRETEVYHDLLNDALSGEMAASGQLGVAKIMAEQLRAAETQQRVSGAGGSDRVEAK